MGIVRLVFCLLSLWKMAIYSQLIINRQKIKILTLKFHNFSPTSHFTSHPTSIPKTTTPITTTFITTKQVLISLSLKKNFGHPQTNGNPNQTFAPSYYPHLYYLPFHSNLFQDFYLTTTCRTTSSLTYIQIYPQINLRVAHSTLPQGNFPHYFNEQEFES